MKPKFKPGDKVVISEFPMKMVSGDDYECELWFKNRQIFTIKQLDPNWEEDQSGEYCYTTMEEGYYFNESSLMLLSKAPKFKKLRSWVLK